MIGEEVEVFIVDIRGDKVRLGISAPKSVVVHRKEIYNAIKEEKENERTVDSNNENSAG